MDLQKEAEEFMDGKLDQFYEGLQDHQEGLAQYLRDNLHDTRELDLAIERLSEATMWISMGASVHGIKEFVDPDTFSTASGTKH